MRANQSETWMAFSPAPRWLRSMPRTLAGVHRGRPPWAKIRPLVWLALSLAFLCAVAT